MPFINDIPVVVAVLAPVVQTSDSAIQHLNNRGLVA